MVHGLVQGGPLSRPARAQRTSGRGFDGQDRGAWRRLRTRRRLQRERGRRDGERQDARLRPVGHGEALYDGSERKRARDHARRR